MSHKIHINLSNTLKVTTMELMQHSLMAVKLTVYMCEQVVLHMFQNSATNITKPTTTH